MYFKKLFSKQKASKKTNYQSFHSPLVDIKKYQHHINPDLLLEIERRNNYGAKGKASFFKLNPVWKRGLVVGLSTALVAGMIGGAVALWGGTEDGAENDPAFNRMSPTRQNTQAGPSFNQYRPYYDR